MENNLAEELSQHFLDMIQKDGEPVFFEVDYVKRVARGVAHCEFHGIDWQKAVLSPRHVVGGESLSFVMTLAPDEPFFERSDEIRKKLRIPDDVEPISLGLPIEHSSFGHDARPRYLNLLFLWIHAVFFMKDRAWSEQLEFKRRLELERPVF